MQNKIKEILPHRNPFLFVDEILELESGKYAIALKHVKEDEYFFKGHFPEKPVMPGVLILEALAQVGALALLSLDKFKGQIGYLVGVDSVRFRDMVLPGDTIRLECELLNFKRNFGYGHGKAYVGDKLVCEGKISFAVK